MSACLRWLSDALAMVFGCNHTEAVYDYTPNRLRLRCLKCQRVSEGIEVGR